MFARVRAVALAAVLLSAPLIGLAQTATSTASNGLTCARDRAGSNLNCTAGEFTTIVNLTLPPGSPTTCVAGSTISLNMIVALSGTNANRYDGAIFVGQNGNDPRNAGGQCSVARFPIISTGNGFTTFDGDTCGDYIAAGVESWQVNNVQVVCQGDPTTGQLAVPYLLSYQQNNPGVCNADSSVLLAPGSPSKCNAGTATVPTLVVRGYVRVTKQTTPDAAAGSFAFTAASSLGTPSPTAFNLGDGQSQLVETNVTGTPRTLTITETLLPGWESGASIVCTNPSGGAAPYVSVNNATRTITANLDTTNFGAECTITNTRLPTVTISKNSVGGVGTFGFTGSNGIAAQNITTVTPGVPVSGAVQTLTAPATGTTITEGVPPAGFTLTAINCTGLGAGGTATPNLGARTVTLDAAATAAGANIACIFTNTRQPVLRLQKSLPLGRYVAGDQFTLSIAGTGGPATVTTSGSATTATGTAVLDPATIAAAYTLSEVGASGANLANYTTTWSCANTLSGGQTPSGSGTSFSVTPVAGDDLTCTFVNTRNLLADLRLTKTNTPGVNGEVDQVADTVVSGAVATYTITATNLGPDAANGAVLTDPAPTGLTCTTAACTAGGGASCPAPTGAALVAALQGAGATIPTLPNGGSVAIVLTCTVN
jgi:uncharacterized repeat protein (TIGR01451 family)